MAAGSGSRPPVRVWPAPEPARTGAWRAAMARGPLPRHARAPRAATAQGPHKRPCAARQKAPRPREGPSAQAASGSRPCAAPHSAPRPRRAPRCTQAASVSQTLRSAQGTQHPDPARPSACSGPRHACATPGGPVRVSRPPSLPHENLGSRARARPSTRATPRLGSGPISPAAGPGLPHRVGPAGPGISSRLARLQSPRRAGGVPQTRMDSDRWPSESVDAPCQDTCASHGGTAMPCWGAAEAP